MCWSVLNSLVSESNIPYKILQGETDNSYYQKLEELILDKQSEFSLKSLQLYHDDKILLQKKKEEYLIIQKFYKITEEIFNHISKDKWKEALMNVSYLHENLRGMEVKH